MTLLEKVYQYPGLSADDVQKIIDCHEYIHISKGHHLLKSGQTANAYYIIESGLMRSYLYDYNNNEITTDLVGKGEIAIEVLSIFQRIPTKEYLQAVTDVQAWKINFDTFQQLFATIPHFPEWGRAWMANQLFNSKKRFTEIITESAAKRYGQLLQEKPQILQLAPLKYIASYLGVTDTSLSRIRKEYLVAQQNLS